MSNTAKQKLHLFDTHLVAVVISPDGTPHESANGYLTEIATRSRSATGDTVRSYAEALVTWLDFLARQRLALNEVTEEQLAHFRNYLQTDTAGQLAKSNNTTRHRLAVACGFCKWAQLRGRFESPLGQYLLLIARDGSGHGNWRGRGDLRKGGMSIAPRKEGRLPRVLNQEEIAHLFMLSPPLYALIFRWCIATGMRRFEVCSLKVSDLPSPDAIDRVQGGLLSINVLRKGSREQTVQVPAALLHETAWYVRTERELPSNDLYADFIFLNSRGRPVNRASVSKVFRKCANRINSDATLHHLRHTFSVHVLSLLDSLESDRPINSLKVLQVLLGHANVQSTEIYLQAMEVTSDAVIKALDFLYGATL
ncbi:tyrosine-type recombinase/integrase [Rhodoferax sp. OV413]|uniref:tyrosine-type recombinase/integrase n=1 Tax=Rhodoferax sp. OV413 TaxID=1855285 RepID=UPI0015A237F9|nr:tyrosine-type recombinase/integrase [Rhodoferax sp. OV413]